MSKKIIKSIVLSLVLSLFLTPVSAEFNKQTEIEKIKQELKQQKQTEKVATETTPEKTEEEKARLKYEAEIKEMLAQKIITENPTAKANKCEVLQMMARIFDWQHQTAENQALSNPFLDTPEWCQDLAKFAFANEIVKGQTAIQLGVKTPISRFEVAVMIYRELQRNEFAFKTDSSAKFSDELVDWAKEAVEKLSSKNFIKGFADGTFGGEQHILKQDLGIVLLRVKPHLESQKKSQDPNSEQNLVGEFQWVKTTKKDQTILTAEKALAPFVISINLEKNFTLKGDCNSIFGNYQLKTETQEITFSDIGTTKMFCLESIETEFLEHLQAVYEYNLDNSNLIFLYSLDAETKGAIHFEKIN